MSKAILGGKSVVYRKSDVLSSMVNEEVVILNVLKGEYNGLDKIGSVIWNELEKPVMIDQLVVKLMEKYDVSKQDCTSDVLLFISELIESGLAEITGESK